MGQKVHPTGIRLGIVKEHTSVCVPDGRTYADYLLADLNVREYLQDKLKSASVSRIDIHRPAQTARITIHTARPGIVIGKKGEDVEKLRQDLTKKMGVPVHINIEEIRKPELDAMLVAQNVAQQLGGAEIARTEWYREGRVPLHTLRADIDYNTYEAHTTYGVIGVKVWIFKGEVIGGRHEELKPQAPAPRKKAAK